MHETIFALQSETMRGRNGRITAGGALRYRDALSMRKLCAEEKGEKDTADAYIQDRCSLECAERRMEPSEQMCFQDIRSMPRCW